MRKYYVYILASKRNGTLYIGVTGSLRQRVEIHTKHLNEGFTDKYNVTRLVYYQEFSDVRDAISAEKRLKKWNRKWKLRIIEEMNPEWLDLTTTEGFGLL